MMKEREEKEKGKEGRMRIGDKKGGKGDDMSLKEEGKRDGERQRGEGEGGKKRSGSRMGDKRGEVDNRDE